ncbi:MAG: hypothetical protein KDD58_06635 [Bdellovibrionales bacterium]|nr:hypothetical protein [Bdellovibrionales bacterium]
MFKIKLILLIVFLTLMGCKKELPNPENLDPIYKDLLSEKKQIEKLLKDEYSNLENLKLEKDKIKPRSLERKISIKEIRKSKEQIAELKQKLKYFEIRTERRRVEARKSYKIAFKNEKEWPDKKEYEIYLVNKRLRNAPMNWNYRVPKLHANNPNFKDLSKLAVKEKEKGKNKGKEE